MNFKFYNVYIILFKGIFILMAYIFVACNSELVTEQTEKGTEVIINCNTTDLAITELDNIVIQDVLEPVTWTGFYNENNISISYTKPISSDGETETYTFIFDKIEGCLAVNRSYKFYDGNLDDVSAITEMNVSEFYIKNWEIDSLFAGIVVYQDPHDKLTYSRKIWVNLEEETQNQSDVNYFEDCFAGKLPLDIDLNKDDTVDFKLIYEESRDIGNTPNFNIYTIKLESTNPDKYEILSPRKNNSPYTIIFEPPFSSNDTRQYFNDVKNALDVFYEFDAPYESYNYFLNNNLTYKKNFENDNDDYFLVRMELNNEIYYGWIKFKFNSLNCEIEILDTYLNSNAGEHIFVQ